MESTKVSRYGSAPKVATLNDTFPTTCPVVQQVRSEYADWYYDTPDGYIRYYKGATAKLYEHRLVAERALGEIPAGHVIRHVNNQRADNRASNLAIMSRSDLAISVMDHQPAQTYTCPVCGKEFKVPLARVNKSSSGKLYCSPECRQFAQRKVKRPSAAKLQELMEEVGNWSELGKMFGVSDNAVRKWAKRYGLDLSICDGRRKKPQD